MAARVVLASKRFQRAYPDFMQKYDDLDRTFRDFLTFRATTRPDESFNQKDSRISGTKFWRCHLIHGKAILIYQLVGTEIRLVDIGDHNIVEGGTNFIMRNYAKSLTADDYYKFDVDTPGKSKQDSNRTRQEASGTPVIDAQHTQDAPDEITESKNEPELMQINANSLWNDRTLNYMRDQQLLYVPRPSQPMIMIRLTKDIIAPKGDVLAIDPANQTIYILTANEVEAHFQPAKQNVTSIAEAFAAAVPETIATTPMPSAPSATPVRPHQGQAQESKRQSVAPQLGRLLLATAYALTDRKTSRLDSMTIRAYLPESDGKLISVLLADGQNKGFIKKAGQLPPGNSSGGRFWYTLTPNGHEITKTLGTRPFALKGITSVFPLPLKIE